ncbi:hypothetical protein ACFL2Q_05995 [Thermodesulfobacteriota bacterium]
MTLKFKKALIIVWLTFLWFALLGNVHAWDVPAYLRITSGARLWFTLLDGDLIQEDKTKLGLVDNLGLKQDTLAYEYFSNFRLSNMHVLRLRFEPTTQYGQSLSGSYQKIFDFRFGYDLDFYMTPQILFGANIDMDVVKLETLVNGVRVAGSTFTYREEQTSAIPSFGLHGTFYPIVHGMALRPHVSTRANWWNFGDRATWEWDVTAGADVPVTHLWTWTVSGGYRVWNVRMDRTRDTADITRTGFFLESSILF